MEPLTSLVDDLFRMLRFQSHHQEDELEIESEHTSSYSGIGIATHNGPKKFNEDRIVKGSSRDHNYLIVADGLGGYPHGGDAAQIAVEVFSKEIEQRVKKNKAVHFEDVKTIYHEAAKEIKKSMNGDRGWKTTVICLIEKANCFLFSYLGDGQIYVVRGDVEVGVPIMLGHRVNGLLGGVLGPELTAEPVVIQMSKSFTNGEMVIAGTDGVFSGEMSRSKPNLLKDFLCYVRDNFASASLDRILFEYLDQLNAQKLLDDNASLGMIVTSKAKEFLLKGKS